MLISILRASLFWIGLVLLASALPLGAQILPDRTVVLDPLGSHAADTSSFTWMNQAPLYAEFSRYNNQSGSDHRWNAKTGGFIEFARWDSSVSINLVGTMEVIMDPNNDIHFNPRAIFWEEGAVVAVRMAGDASLQFGYIHRCKHDIDNVEILLADPRRQNIQQRTLIYSGIMTRALWRRRSLFESLPQLTLSASLRNDFFLHLLDDRLGENSPDVSQSMERLIDAVNASAKFEYRPKDARYAVHAEFTAMLSLFGAKPGFGERFSGVSALGSVPVLELGMDFFNPAAAEFTIFARGEWQRDAGISSMPSSATLLLFGVRVAPYQSSW